MPISCSIETRSSVAILPVAPAGTGQPPISPKLDSILSQPPSSAASTLARPWPRVLWKCAVSSTSSPSASRATGKNARTWRGLAMPVVSPKPISCAPAATSRRAIAKTRSRGTSPSYGQPKLTLITPSQRRPASRARGRTRSSPVSDSSTERLTFLRLCVSEALRKTLISSRRSRSSSACSRPRSLGTSTETLTSPGISARARTSRASASCGMTSARTKLVTSRRLRPVRASSSTSRILSSVAMTSGSFWKPSRGPTSRMRTRSGSTLHHAPFMGADADRALALEDLDVEPVLAAVDDLAQRRARDAPCALDGARHVLDADLEADGRLPVGELLEREHRGGALHHADHPGRREHLDRDGPADIGQQTALDGELGLAGVAHRPSWIARRPFVQRAPLRRTAFVRPAVTDSPAFMA